MRLILIFAVLMIGTRSSLAQKMDTLKLKEEVSNLKAFSKKLFLKILFEKDQAFRGKQTNDSIDLQNLISISYFINDYGYPTRREYGKYSSVPMLIWIHNKYSAIDQLTFPIILKGYLEGEIRESELRNYYLRRLYNNKIDDENYKNILLKELFEICEVRLDDKISVWKILKEKAKIDSLNGLEVLNETLWKTEDIHKSYKLNDENIDIEVKGQKIKIIQKKNGNIFVLNVNEDHSGEIRELQEISSRKYKYKDQKTEKYFEFFDDKILYKDSNRTIREYKSITWKEE